MEDNSKIINDVRLRDLYKDLIKICNTRCDTISFWKKRCKQEKCVDYLEF